MKTLKDLTKSWKNNHNIAIVDRKEFRRFTYTYDQLYTLARKFGTILKNNNVKNVAHCLNSSSGCIPNIPDGLTRRTRTRMTKATEFL